MQRNVLTAILFWAVLVAVFVLLSASVSLVAAGYQFDWQTKRLQKTGLLFLSGEPRTATIVINEQPVAETLPFRLSAVFPGEYAVTITKDGYVPWHKVFLIDAGSAATETDIKLFLQTPEVSAVTDPELVKRVKENTAPSSLINGQELRVNNVLVTRVSGSLVTAALSDDRAHVFFQIDKELRVIETDGTNELLLYTLDANGSSQLISVDNDKELVVLDGGTVKRIRIR